MLTYHYHQREKKKKPKFEACLKKEMKTFFFLEKTKPNTNTHLTYLFLSNKLVFQYMFEFVCNI